MTTLFGPETPAPPKATRTRGPSLVEIHVYPDKGGPRWGSKWWNGREWRAGCADASCALGAVLAAIEYAKVHAAAGRLTI